MTERTASAPWRSWTSRTGRRRKPSGPARRSIAAASTNGRRSSAGASATCDPLRPAVLLHQLGLGALVENFTLHVRVAAGAVEVLRQQPARRRGHVLEVSIPVRAAHVRNEQPFAGNLLHRRRDEA